MGSSKKHKEKREEKKHKKARSRSRERESHKRGHKSSHRDRRKSHDRRDEESKISERKKYEETCYDSYKDFISDDIQSFRGVDKVKVESPESFKPGKIYSPDISDDDFDIDKLLDSKLSENLETYSRKSQVSKITEEDFDQSMVVEKGSRKRPYAYSDDSKDKFVSELIPETASTSYQSFKDEYTSLPFIEKDLSFESNVEVGNSDSTFITSDKKHKIKEKVEKLQKKHKSKHQSVEEIYEKNMPSIEPENLIMGHKGEVQTSLSIAEANKLRAKLGLKPLDVPDEIPGLEGDNAEGETELSKTKNTEVFVKTENIADIKKAEKMREKLSTFKEKRKIVEKLNKVKGLGEAESDDESAASWVRKSRKLQEEKEQAEKRAKLLEEMDAEFGIGALVEEEFKKKKAYTSTDLRGLKVAHSADVVKEGQHIILTLKDKGVLDEEDDILQNVNLVDEEHYAKNVENKKKKPEYRPYEEPEFDEFGILQKKNILSKYDDEIEGVKQKSFVLGSTSYVNKEKEIEMIRMKLKQQQQGITLDMPNVKIANEYFTPYEMVNFKKPKRKVRKLKRLKADDLLGNPIEDFTSVVKPEQIEKEDEYLYGEVLRSQSVQSETAEKPMDVPQLTDTKEVVIEEDQAEKELHLALNKARKLKQKKILSEPEKVAEMLKSEEGDSQNATKKGSTGAIVLNSTAEFCRTLGDIPTYGMSGNRDEEADELMDFERELMEERQKQELEAQNRGAWNEVEIDEKPAEIVIRENEPILEEEPDISLGVAGALTLAMKKGYLDKEVKKAVSGPKASQLQAKSYTIEEKFYEDDKFGKRDRYTGPIQDFKEKNTYKPDIKLEYIDDSGRRLNAKEAFRYLSHKFHGKGPGKNKVDKRMKKLEQDTRLKQMSSTDTPLNTVKLLQAKQKETQSPYIILSGGSKTLTQTMISKTK